MKAKLAGLGVAGLLAGVGAAWVSTDAGADRPPIPSATLVLLVGWSFIGGGLLSWRARPENRIGPIMIVTGFFWFASVPQDAHSALPFTIGYALQVVYLAGFVYLILAFPSGRLRGPVDRAIVVTSFGPGDRRAVGANVRRGLGGGGLRALPAEPARNRQK